MLEIIIYCVIALISIPILMLTLESVVAVLPSTIAKNIQGINLLSDKLRTVVLIPAHNEEKIIGSTLDSILSQLRPNDSIIVIADNCVDETASIARAKGADVIERNDLKNQGKGYALDYGLNALREHPPDIVVIMDADVICQKGCIPRLALKALETNRPVQACYLLSKSTENDIKSLISVFAFRFKNMIRPLGLLRLGAPCLLTGTGMAFPWKILKSVPLASNNLVEDMQLGLDLALPGYNPIFCPEARLTSPCAISGGSARTQRTRWEHGHLKTIISQVPRLLLHSIRQFRFDLFLLALEVGVPPLSLLVLSWSACITATSVLAIIGIVSWNPTILLVTAGSLLGFSIFLGWFKFGRDLIRLRTLFSAPFYMLWKLPIYLQFVVKQEKNWVRTDRK